MNYVKDNTFKDPAFIVGVKIVGDAYLVAPLGASGEWFGKDDQIATWGGSVWSFFQPTTGAEYQVTEGRNAGRIYVRTAVTSDVTNIVPNGNLDQDTALYPAWALTTTAGGNAGWDSSYTGQILLTSLSAPDTAKAKVTFPVIAGVKYRLFVATSGLLFYSPDSAVNWVVRNETGSADVATGTFTVNNLALFFTPAVTGDFSFAVEAIGYTGSEIAEIILESVECKRYADLATNGNFSSDFTGWTAPTPWVIDTGGSPPFSGKTAFGVIDYPGHTPSPALEQVMTPLQVGVIYRVGFNCSGNFTRGTISLAVDGATIVDVLEEGTFDFYFRASATSHTLQFPLTKTGFGNFEARIDNVTLTAALWAAQPIAQGGINAHSTMTCAVAKGRRIAVVIAASSLMTCGSARNRTIQPIIPAVSTMTGAVTKISARPVSGLIAAQSSMQIGNLGHVRFVGGTIAAKSTMKAQFVDNGYYTVAMAIDSITELWSSGQCSCECDGAGPLQKEALGYLNAAMQRLNASGREWGFVSNAALELGPAVNVTGSMMLPKNVVSVRRCVFHPAIDDAASVFADFDLRELGSRHELDAYRRSSGRDLWPLSAAESVLRPYNLPIAFFIEAEDDTTGQGSPQLRILFAPVFNANRTWKVETQVHLAPARLTTTSITDGSRLPVPHQHAETLLVPLAKYYALSSRRFRRPELKESVESLAMDALAMTGEIQPAGAEAGKETKGERKS